MLFQNAESKKDRASQKPLDSYFKTTKRFELSTLGHPSAEQLSGTELKLSTTLALPPPPPSPT
jgi:hypothetical protein